MKKYKSLKKLNNKGYEIEMMITFLLLFALFLLIIVVLAYRLGL